MISAREELAVVKNISFEWELEISILLRYSSLLPYFKHTQLFENYSGFRLEFILSSQY